MPLLPHVIVLPYIGRVLSINHYRYRRTGPIRRETKRWMDDLAQRVADLWAKQDAPSILYVKLSARFRDRRSAPDLANLHKVIGDAIEAGLAKAGKPLDDRYYRFEDEGFTTDKHQEPQVYIVLEGV